MDSKSVSPSRKYVAVCNRSNFDGFYMRKFDLPTCDPWNTAKGLKNTSQDAEWFFLNRLDFTACIQGCIAYEDYCDLSTALPV